MFWQELGRSDFGTRVKRDVRVLLVPICRCQEGLQEFVGSLVASWRVDRVNLGRDNSPSNNLYTFENFLPGKFSVKVLVELWRGKILKKSYGVQKAESRFGTQPQSW